MNKILVIDDKQENLYVIEEIINERLVDTQVFSKQTGKEGIKCAVKELPDVILLDLMMPVMDGFEVCSKLKSNSKTKHLPVVIISSKMTDAKSKIKVLELGADAFLTKPIGPTELVAQINAMIRIKKAEDKLREEKLILGSIINKESKKTDFALKRYKKIFDKNIAGVVETTFDGKIISCNSAFVEMLGLKSVEEVVENKITSFYKNKNDREKIISLLKEKKEVLNYEVEAVNKNGKPSIALFRSFNIEDKNILSFIIDVTNIKESEKELRKSQQRLSNHLDNSPLGAIFWDINFKVVDWNHSAERIFGYTKDEALGKHIKELIVIEEYQAKTDKILIQILTKKEGEHNTYENVTKDGKRIICEWYNVALTDESGKVNGVASLVEDITEKIRVKEQLKKSEQHYRNLFNSINDFICVHDLDGNILSMNPAAEKNIGYRIEEVLNKNLSEFLAPEVKNQFKDYLTKIKEEGKAKGLMVVQTRTGEKRIWEYNNSLVKTESNEQFISGIAKDVTEQKHLEKHITDLAIILENSLNEIYIFDATTLNFINVNKGVRQNIGYTYDEIRRLTPLDIKPEFTIKDFEELIEPLRSHKKDIIKFETVHQRKDGSRYPVEVHLQLTTLEEKEVFVAIIIDITEREKSEYALRESEASLNEAQKIANIGNWTRELTGELYWSDQQYRIYGYEPGEIKPNFEIVKSHVHPNDLENFKKVFSEAVKTHQSIDFKYRLISKNGTLKFVYAKANIELDKSGKPIRLRGILQDITERKKAEEKVKRSEKRYRDLFEDNMSGVFISTIEGNILECNEALVKMFGYSSKDELISINTNNFYHRKNDRSLFIEELRKKGYLYNYEMCTKRKDGTDLWTLENVRLISDKIFQGTIMDITKRKETEKKILQLSRGLEQSPAMVTITDMDGILEYVNPKVTEITGYTTEELIGKNSNILSSGQTSKETYEELWDTILQGKVWKGELLNKKKNGELYWDSETIAPIINNEGDIINFISIREDITEKKEKELELKKAKEKAEESNKVKTKFFANMSHELRTPLVGILGFSEIIKDESDNEEFKEYGAMIYASTVRLQRTLNSILDFSKIDDKTFKFEFDKINVNVLVNQEFNLFTVDAEKKQIDYELNVDKDPIIINSDSRLLSSIFNHLIDNGIKYTNKGFVEVNVSKVSERGSLFLLFKVKDSGIGIEKKQLKVIWDEFRQVSEGLARNYEGLGLGLSIVKKFVGLLNGTIEVESEFNKGSIFSVKIPIERFLKEDYVSNKIKIKLGEKQDKLILVVEDDPLNALTIKKFLVNCYHVEHTATPKDSMEKCSTKTYNLVLMDINLKSDMDGVALMNLLKESFIDYKDVPFIAQTAYAMNEDKEKFLESGFSDFISKPYTRKALLEIVEKNLIFKV